MIQTTASESTFVCLLAGRTEAIKKYQVLPSQQPFVMVILSVSIQTMFPDMEDAEINSRLVGYCSDQVTREKCVSN